MNYTFLFPGQGSQSVGMGKDFYEKFTSAKECFEKANSILGRDIVTVIFSGPAELLTETQNTQPAIFIVESAIVNVLKENKIKPYVTAGHSLGEYSALYAAGVISFEDGLKLVAKRGELMAEAGKRSSGTMAAIIGLKREMLLKVLSDVKSGIVVPANENSPEQIVISGEVSAIEEAMEKCKEAGAAKTIRLPVSGAFHSPLMKEAADSFAELLNSVTFYKPECPVICNVSGKPEDDVDTIKSLLSKQMLSPVKWIDTMESLGKMDYGTCLEIGPGVVLKGLAKKCNGNLNVISCGSINSLLSLLG